MTITNYDDHMYSHVPISYEHLSSEQGGASIPIRIVKDNQLGRPIMEAPESISVPFVTVGQPS